MEQNCKTMPDKEVITEPIYFKNKTPLNYITSIENRISKNVIHDKEGVSQDTFTINGQSVAGELSENHNPDDSVNSRANYIAVIPGDQASLDLEEDPFAVIHQSVDKEPFGKLIPKDLVSFATISNLDGPSPKGDLSANKNQSKAENILVNSSPSDLDNSTASDLDAAYSEEDPYATDSDPDYELVEEALRTDTEETEDSENREKRKTRKRSRNADNWRRNRIKRLRNSGKSYKNWSNKEVSARKMKPACTCRMKCSTKCNEEMRKAVFEQYWDLGDVNRQRDFISKYVKFLPKSRCRQRLLDNNDDEVVNSRRNYTYVYNFPLLNNVETIQVCKTFFLNTLDISAQVVKTVACKSMDNITVPADKRGTVKKNSQLPVEVKESVRQHIKSFVPVDSHYCRKDSNRLLLPPTLNIAKMYSLYREYCESNNISQIASSAIYRQVFNTEFNISFLVPKKDLCDLCNKFENSTIEQKAELQEEYNVHIKSKDLAREVKNTDKERAKHDANFCACVFDLEQILPAPKTEVGLAYYKLKLSTYNFTVFSLGSKKCTCFMWHEGIAKRGASEIGSSLLLFVKQAVDEGIKEFSFFSDNCAGQNRNKYLYSLYNFLANKHNIKIRHSYLEKGHTQNEGDSVHSMIERASKNIPIFVPDQWYTLVRTAKRSHPQYEVKELTKEVIFDLKDLQKNTTLNWDKDINNDKVKWQRIKVIEVNAEYPNTLLFKYDYEEVEYKRLNLLQKGRKSITYNNNYTLKQLYLSGIPISRKKYEHLIFLCNKLVITEPYHNFFKSLPYSDNATDELDSDNE